MVAYYSLKICDILEVEGKLLILNIWSMRRNENQGQSGMWVYLS